MTDSKVPRDTKALVASVAKKKTEVRLFAEIGFFIHLLDMCRIPNSLIAHSMPFRAYLMKLGVHWMTQSCPVNNFYLLSLCAPSLFVFVDCC